MTCWIRLRAVGIALAGLLATGAAAQAPTPKDPVSPAPGYVDGRGPTGPVAVKIVAPRPDEIIPLPEGADKANVSVRFDVTNFEIFQDKATKTGQSVQIVFDESPPFSDYDVTRPWLFKNVPRGTHTIRAFAARPWFESIKEPAAFAMVTFHVGEKNGKSGPAPGEPVLTLLRPKGAKAEKVMLDFFVSGCRVSDEHTPDSCRVRYRLDDKPEVTLSRWEPVWWEGLAPGKHAFVLGITRDGKVLTGAYTMGKRTFEVPSKAAAPATAQRQHPDAG